MTPEERVQVEALCKRIQEEQDPAAFTELVMQLNDLLEHKQGRLDSHPKGN